MSQELYVSTMFMLEATAGRGWSGVTAWHITPNLVHFRIGCQANNNVPPHCRMHIQPFDRKKCLQLSAFSPSAGSSNFIFRNRILPQNRENRKFSNEASCFRP
jgi:hypothetical protein